MDRFEFIAKARSYIGTPFMHQGRLPGVGLDCAGVAVCAARELGEEVSDYLFYTRMPSAAVFLRKLNDHCDRIQVREMRAGDLIIFEFDSNPQHLAILTEEDPPYILHAYMPAHRVIEHRMDDLWSRKIRAVFRMKGVE